MLEVTVDAKVKGASEISGSRHVRTDRVLLRVDYNPLLLQEQRNCRIVLKPTRTSVCLHCVHVLACRFRWILVVFACT